MGCNSSSTHTHTVAPAQLASAAETTTAVQGWVSVRNSDLNAVESWSSSDDSDLQSQEDLDIAMRFFAAGHLSTSWGSELMQRVNKHLGQGSRFALPEKSEEQKSAVVPHDDRVYVILLVDIDPRSSRKLTYWLTSQGFIVHAVCSGERAVEWIHARHNRKSGHNDVTIGGDSIPMADKNRNGDGTYRFAADAVVDLIIADRSAFVQQANLLDYCRGDDALSEIPLVFLSRDIAPLSVQRAMQRGAYDVITFPLCKYQLIGRVKALLFQRQLVQMYVQHYHSQVTATEESVSGLPAYLEMRAAESPRSSVGSTPGRSSSLDEPATPVSRLRFGGVNGGRNLPAWLSARARCLVIAGNSSVLRGLLGTIRAANMHGTGAKTLEIGLNCLRRARQSGQSGGLITLKQREPWLKTTQRAMTADRIVVDSKPSGATVGIESPGSATTGSYNRRMTSNLMQDGNHSESSNNDNMTSPLAQKRALGHLRVDVTGVGGKLGESPSSASGTSVEGSRLSGTLSHDERVSTPGNKNGNKPNTHANTNDNNSSSGSLQNFECVILDPFARSGRHCPLCTTMANSKPLRREASMPIQTDGVVGSDSSRQSSEGLLKTPTVLANRRVSLTGSRLPLSPRDSPGVPTYFEVGGGLNTPSVRSSRAIPAFEFTSNSNSKKDSSVTTAATPSAQKRLNGYDSMGSELSVERVNSRLISVERKQNLMKDAMALRSADCVLCGVPVNADHMKALNAHWRRAQQWLIATRKCMEECGVRVPLIVVTCTSFSRPEYVNALMRNGADEVLVRPLAQSILKARVQCLVALSLLTAEFAKKDSTDE